MKSLPRALTGAPASFAQSNDRFSIDVGPSDHDTPVTVIELTLDGDVESGHIVGDMRSPLEAKGSRKNNFTFYDGEIE